MNSTTQSSMADDYPRSRACLIKGDSSPFIVEPEGNIDIMELRDKERGQERRAR